MRNSNFYITAKETWKIIQGSEIIQRLNLPDVLKLVGYFLAQFLLLIVILYRLTWSVIPVCYTFHLWKNSNFQHSGTKGSPLWSNVKRQKHDFELGQSLELIVVRPGLGSDLKSRKELKLWVNQSGFSKPFFLEGKIFPSFDLVKF
jgi:hypothetical protein